VTPLAEEKEEEEEPKIKEGAALSAIPRGLISAEQDLPDLRGRSVLCESMIGRQEKREVDRLVPQGVMINRQEKRGFGREIQDPEMRSPVQEDHPIERGPSLIRVRKEEKDHLERKSLSALKNHLIAEENLMHRRKKPNHDLGRVIRIWM
jgi:hypothetical protein